MKKVLLPEPAKWSTVLLILVVFTVFFVAFFPVHVHAVLYRLMFTAIYYVGILNMSKYRKPMLIFSILVLALNWISVWLEANLLLSLSRTLNIIFFLFVVMSLIRQVAKAKTVSAKVILEAINGYVLVGMIFAMIVAIIAQTDPGSFNFHSVDVDTRIIAANFNEDLYFAFITMATVGYGDMLPLSQVARSFATFIGISGQLYIAIIIAMLVGKFAAQQQQD